MNCIVNNKKIKQPEYAFKILYALGMVFIVAGHCGNGGISLLYEWFAPYGFHLGLFAFCSGYFYDSENENQIWSFIEGKIKKLIFPLYAWNFFYAIIVLILANFNFSIGGNVTIEKLTIMPITTGHQFSYNLGGWFVIPLFQIHVFNVIFRKYISLDTRLKETFIFVIYVLLGMMGVFLSSHGYNKGLWLVLVRMLYFIPFYGLGHFYKYVRNEYKYTFSYRTVYKYLDNYFIVIILALQLGCITYCRKCPSYIPSWCNNFNDGIFIPFLTGFLGIVFWLKIAYVVEPICGRNKIIGYIADNSYSIMINQFLGFLLINVTFAIVNHVTGWFADFNYSMFQRSVFYIYVPLKLQQYKILYLISGLTIPIIMQKMVNLAIKKVK